MDKNIKGKAEYCLNCKMRPCMNKGCPLQNNIPAFVEQIRNNNIEEAYKILSKTTLLESVCGRICPHLKQCEGSCIRGIKDNPVSIGELETFVGDYAIKNNLKIEKNIEDKFLDKKVAVIGGGPAGLMCAGFLAKKGINVTIYEKYNYLGGLLVHGIPEFRLNKNIIKNTIDKILDLGIRVEYNNELGKNLSIDELINDYDYIFIAIGANISTKMGIIGENLDGVYGGNELLEYKSFPDFAEKKVIINGGGNVAIDTARTVNKLGAKEVTIVYRRSFKEMPAEQKEIKNALKEGIKILYQNNIVKINGNENVESVELIKTELVSKEGETRLYPVNIEGSNYVIGTDYVIMALGSKPENFVSKIGIQVDANNRIIVDKNGRTSNEKIYAGGDIINSGKGTVAWAAKNGRDVAESIIKII